MFKPRPPSHPHWWTDVPRNPAVDLRLGASLSFVAGATNAGGFLAVGQYTSHMTGLLSSIADHLVLGQFALVLAAIAGIAAFIGGAMTTAVMVNWSQRRQLRSAYARPLILEIALLLVFGLAGASIQLQFIAHLAIPLTVLLLCFIMGLQNAVMTKISHAEIRTTHMTGLITDIGIELGKMAYVNRSRLPLKVHANRRKLRLHLILVCFFLLGALLGAYGFKQWGYITTVPLAAWLTFLVWGPVQDDVLHGRLAPQAHARPETSPPDSAPPPHTPTP